ncbi:Asp23/Gls24 family envelope stress response protein [Streptomyces pinistramenti]|uniref:Asp23/Gls24 family envelope stress response protein n=1 Tax=Streptomyces pinistramenti TaxID=2884812 RepID=UPI001D076110|nr:Asp23/Gls24 family envelope stress response protein [Streptomyces pinistramenti]MCB5905950.1 Asp23/Gls24 family envelope stress response protein [Streptomyces pinistramenti]
MSRPQGDQSPRHQPQQHARVLKAAAEAARETPGVAFLRPGLGDLLRGAVPRRSGGGPAADTRMTGVRAERQDHPERWHLRIHLAVRTGHRALDVTRAVRARTGTAVREALADGGPAPAVSITVTVTDIT